MKEEQLREYRALLVAVLAGVSAGIKGSKRMLLAYSKKYVKDRRLKRLIRQARDITDFGIIMNMLC